MNVICTEYETLLILSQRHWKAGETGARSSRDSV
jgi:hypothetical protein